jgi:excisionase family DNA binding protein
MKTIEETAQYFGLPKHFCRRAVLEGKVVYVRTGRKYLINIEKFAEWLNAGEQDSEPIANNIQYGQIRRVT